MGKTRNEPTSDAPDNGTPAGDPATTPPATTPEGGQPDNTPEPLTWETWYADQGEPVQTLITSHTSGLKSALDNERQQRKGFEKQLKDLSKKADEGSDLRESLDRLSADVETANARADFFEAASDPTLGLRDARLAWSILQSDLEAFTRRGKPDFEALKAAHPILFEKPRAANPPASAGSGTQSPAPNKSANERMNDFIRGARG